MKALLCFTVTMTMVAQILSLRRSPAISSSATKRLSFVLLRMSHSLTTPAKVSGKAGQLAAGLSIEQYNAVHCLLNSVAVVVSGPGSGKTAVLTKRIAYLLQNNQRASSILALTFTNKAASEMKDRIGHLLEDLDVKSENKSNFDYLFVGTFHAFCVRMLRAFGDDRLKAMTNNPAFDSNFSIVDSDDSSKYIKEIMLKKKISIETFKPMAVLGAVQKMKLAKLMAASGLDVKGDPLPKSSKEGAMFDFVTNLSLRNCAKEVMEEYSQKVYDSNSLDFEDLLMMTYRLFREGEDVRAYLSDRYKHILVDEFQDTNALQYELIKVLFPVGSNGAAAGSERSMFVVGDFDQSIYSWRGALPTNIDKVNQQYKGVDVHRLVANYRSTPHITSVANSILQKMATDSVLSKGSGKYAPARVIKVANEEEEIGVITKVINALGKRDTIALLYRTNAQSRVLEQGMVKAGIPYRLLGGSKFYDRKEIKDIMAYLRLLINPLDKIALERSLNTPNRGIGPKTSEKFLQWVESSALAAKQRIRSEGEGGDVKVVQRVPTVFDHFAWLQRDGGGDVSFADIGDLDDLEECPLGAAEKNKLMEFGKLISLLLQEARINSLPMLVTTLVRETNFQEYLRKQSDSEAQASDRLANVLELISACKAFSLKNKEGAAEVAEAVAGERDVLALSPADSLEIALKEITGPATGADEIQERAKPEGSLPPAITATSNLLLQFVQESLLYAGDVENFGGGGGDDDEKMKPRVSLMTIHASKGLEFDSVFVTGCEDGFLPLNFYSDTKGGASRDTKEEEDRLAEEKRLLYVAVTRARSHLVLTHRHEATVFKGGKMVTSSLRMSRFLAPLASLGNNVCMFMTYKMP